MTRRRRHLHCVLHLTCRPAVLQLQHGFVNSDAALHTDLLTDRLATENYQRYRSATVLLFLGDDDSPAGAAGSGASRNWSLVFPMARGGAWRGSAVPFEYKAIHEQGKQVRVQQFGFADVCMGVCWVGFAQRACQLQLRPP